MTLNRRDFIGAMAASATVGKLGISLAQATHCRRLQRRERGRAVASSMRAAHMNPTFLLCGVEGKVSMLARSATTSRAKD